MKFFDIVKLTQKELKGALVKELKNNGYNPVAQDGFIYAEGNVPVLLVAHMDTVHKEKCTIICTSNDGDVVMSPQGIGGDDRCGIYMILETIKELKCSVLFTEDEETGCVGAGKFVKSGIKPNVPLNYIVEYDRKGSNDAVYYDCDNPEFEAFVTEVGFKTAFGSCSDICDIAPYLELAAVNISCGYYEQHTKHEYVVMSEMLNNIERGKQLIRKPSEKFIWIEAEPVYKGYSFGAYTGYGSPYYKGYNSYYKDYDRYDMGAAKKSYDKSEDFYANIYSNIDEVAFEMYERSYGVSIKTMELVPVVELCGYKEGKLIISTVDGDEEMDDYCCPDILYMSKDDCGLYVIDDDNMWDIQVAVRTDDYMKMKNGKDVMYYPNTLEKFVVMSASDAADFTDYVDNYLEYDIEYAHGLGELI